jgi:predicted nucleic acid-binding Zn ribbon protein
MSRRTAPRPIAEALSRLTVDSAPAGLLARVQAAWPEVAGPALAAEAEPRSERSGRVTIACRSAVWAQELTLLSADLVDRLNEALGASGEAPPISSLRFVVAAP